MGKTREYMDYLDDKIGIAPASSQEELEAAGLIADIFGDHGLEPSVEELDTSPYAGAIRPILSILLICCLIACGLVEGGVHVVLIVVGLLLSALLLFCHFGFDLFENFGPASGSQNVVAVHRAEGDKVVKGARPIVIVAHLDTPRESLLHGPLARAHAPLKQAAAPCMIVACVAFLFQALIFLPDMIVRILWVLGLIALIPVTVLSVVTLIDRHLPCTDGANDNKSSIAALLSIMDHVQPSDDRVTAGEAAAKPRRRAGDESVSAPVPRRVEVVEEVFGVRHGAAVLNSLGILPPTCEVIYEEPKVRFVEEEPDRPLEIDETFEPETEPETEAETTSIVLSEDIDDVETDKDIESVSEEPEDVREDIEEDFEQPEEADFVEDRRPSRFSMVAGWFRDRAQDVRDRINSRGEDIEIESGEDRRGRHERRDAFDEWVDRVDEEPIDDHDGPYVDDDTAIDDGRDGYEYEDEDYRDGYEDDYVDDEYYDDYEDEDEVVEDELRPLASHQVGQKRSGYEETPEAAQDEPEDMGTDEGSAETFETPVDESEPSGDVDVADEGDQIEEPVQSEEPVERETTQTDQPVSDYDSEDEWVDYDDDYEYEDEEPEDGYDYEDEYVDDEPRQSASFLSRIKEWFSRLGSRATVKDDYDYDDDYDDDDEYEDEEYEDDGYYEDDEYLEDDGGVKEEYDDRAEADHAEARDDAEHEDRYEEETPVDAVRNDGRRTDDMAYEADVVEEDEYGYAEYEDEEYDEEEDAVQPSNDAEPLAEPLPDPNILHFDREEDDDILPRDTTGLDRFSDSYDLIDSEQARVRPQADPVPIDDPNWGVSTFQPTTTSMNIARRAALFDLPDPTQKTIDPLRADDMDDEYEDDYEGYDDYPDDERGDDTDAVTSGQSGQGDWKGGATKRSDLLETESADGTDLADAILELGDDFLVAHDIWFVVTGASEYNHAGIKAFIDEHRRDIRGAFLVNLESVGSGALGVYVREGLTGQRRADKRLVRLIKNVADDLHVGIDTAAMTWDETDAATPMRSRVRAVSIVGLDDTNQPALSHTRQDIPENVRPKQVHDVVRIVCEMIRRS